MYKVVKTFGHNEGLSCCFRQWRAESHCNLLHGYALSIELEFETRILDDRNWVVDFGDFKLIKEFLHKWFDHTTLIAKDDPHLQQFIFLHEKKLINLKIIDIVGCESFAEFIFNELVNFKICDKLLTSVTVKEHDSNSATYERK